MEKPKEQTGGPKKRRTQLMTVVKGREEDYPGVGGRFFDDATFVIELQQLKGPGGGEAQQVLMFRDEDRLTFECEFATAIEVELFAAVMRRALGELERVAAEVLPAGLGTPPPPPAKGRIVKDRIKRSADKRKRSHKKGAANKPVTLDRAKLCDLHDPKKKPSSRKKVSNKKRPSLLETLGGPVSSRP